MNVFVGSGTSGAGGQLSVSSCPPPQLVEIMGRKGTPPPQLNTAQLKPKAHFSHKVARDGPVFASPLSRILYQANFSDYYFLKHAHAICT